MNTMEKCIAYSIAIVFTAVAVFLVSVSYMMFQEAKYEAVRTLNDYRPEIPQCDKPVWDRIIDGCGE